MMHTNKQKRGIGARGTQKIQYKLDYQGASHTSSISNINFCLIFYHFLLDKTIIHFCTAFSFFFANFQESKFLETPLILIIQKPSFCHMRSQTNLGPIGSVVFYVYWIQTEPRQAKYIYGCVIYLLDYTSCCNLQIEYQARIFCARKDF